MLDRLLVYHPSPWMNRDWTRLSGLPLEDVWIQAADAVRVFGWYVGASPTQAVLLWCHGNVGNITNRLANLVELYHRGLSVFLFDYRGYGRSTGTPSEAGLYRDALAAYDYLIQTRGLSPSQIVIFGRSLGAAVAGEVASQRAAAGFILESSFPSIQAMANVHYWGLPAQWLVEAKFDLAGKVARVSIPTLVVHGERDRIVPLELGRRVFDAVRAPKSFYLVSGAGHNDVPIVGGQAYFHRWQAFVREVVP